MGVLDDVEARGRRRERFPVGLGVKRTANLEFEALSRVDYEALVAAHTDEDGESDDGFQLALAAACSVDARDDVARWEGILNDVLNAGEANALHQFLIYLNWGSPGPGPKGD